MRQIISLRRHFLVRIAQPHTELVLDPSVHFYEIQTQTFTLAVELHILSIQAFR
jgi:hypothetical protein